MPQMAAISTTSGTQYSSFEEEDDIGSRSTPHTDVFNWENSITRSVHLVDVLELLIRFHDLHERMEFASYHGIVQISNFYGNFKNFSSMSA